MKTLDLTACDREPIHIPGSIQPHGVLLVASDAGVVSHVAGDSVQLLGVEPEKLAGRLLSALLPAEVTALAPASDETTPPRHLGQFDSASGGKLDVVAHGRAGRLLVEIEPADVEPGAGGTLTLLQNVAHRFDVAADLRALCHAAAQAISRITGYGRVMVYRFLEDGSGVVIAEEKAAGLPPFLNHHFPASDIPRQARELYLRNLLRVIPDVSYAPAPLVPPEPQGAPVDMSDCGLRSVSPIHVQYLKNMGVSASMSVSLVKDGALWGLIACHHGEARRVPYGQRELCRHIGQMLSQHLKARAEAESYAEGLRLQAGRDGLVASIGRSPSIEHWLADHVSELLTVLPADGAALVYGDDIRTVGRAPDPGQIAELAARLIADRSFETLATESLAELHPQAASYKGVASGLLASLLSRDDRLVLMWFRAERVATIEWAGNPHKPAEPGAAGEELTPRKSFEVWTETVRGRSRPWTDAELRAGRHLRDILLDLLQRERIVALNLQLRRTLADKEELLAQKDLLMREANHRVQNSLQLVGSMLQLQAQRTTNPEVRSEFEEAQRRLAAVSIIHRRLWHSDQIENVDLTRYFSELRRELVQSWGEAWEDNIRMEIAPMLIPTTLAVSLALILIELMTNAVKYAYDGEAGPVEVSVRRDGAHRVQLIVADSGKGYRPSKSTGFGSRLVKGLVSRSDGEIDVTGNDPGTRVVIVMPVREAPAAFEQAGSGAAVA